MTATQELEQGQREFETEQRRQRYLNTHGDIITQGDIEAWKRDHPAIVEGLCNGKER